MDEPHRSRHRRSIPIGAALLITLREGLEAALIISVLLAYLRRLDRRDGMRLVWWGAWVAIAVSIVVGGVIFFLGAEFDGTAEQLFEGSVSLVAVVVLTWMIFWMRREGARIKSSLEQRVDTALAAGGFALAALSFATVAKEGVETALFVFAAAKGTAVSSGGVGEQVLGAFLGLLAAFGLGALLYRGAIKLDLRTFFTWTGALILIVAAGLFAFSVHELQEAGALPLLRGTAYDVSRALSDTNGVGGILRALFGYQANPTWLQVVAWLGYVGITGTCYLRPVVVTEKPSHHVDATR